MPVVDNLPAVLLAAAGALVAFRRLLWRAPADAEAGAGPLPFVSIIIPARNEEHNLPPLLDSLKALEYPSFEVIVADDGSTDRTAEVAHSYGVQTFAVPPRPAGWNPKNWACRQAAERAKGEVLLFTDADTVHRPLGLRRALSFLRAERADLLSCLPFHRCPTWWEKLMGPFHALVLVATAPAAPKHRRLYAVGQYLLFDRGFYARSGGHEAVAAQYPDDLALANLCLEKGGRYRVFTGDPFFEVRMYDSFTAFIDGWRRNFQAGLRQSRATAGLETILVVAALLAAGRPADGWPTLLPAALIAILVLARQRRWGQFSAVGAVFYPFALAVHATVTLFALFDWARGGAIQWKNRELTGWTAPR